MENGNLKLRNKRFLKYATKGPDRHVQFNHQGDDQGRVHEEPDNSRGQPVLNADNAESNVTGLVPGLWTGRQCEPTCGEILSLSSTDFF